MYDTYCCCSLVYRCILAVYIFFANIFQCTYILQRFRCTFVLPRSCTKCLNKQVVGTSSTPPPHPVNGYSSSKKKEDTGNHAHSRRIPAQRPELVVHHPVKKGADTKIVLWPGLLAVPKTGGHLAGATKLPPFPNCLVHAAECSSEHDWHPDEQETLVVRAAYLEVTGELEFQLVGQDLGLVPLAEGHGEVEEGPAKHAVADDPDARESCFCGIRDHNDCSDEIIVRLLDLPAMRMGDGCCSDVRRWPFLGTARYRQKGDLKRAAPRRGGVDSSEGGARSLTARGWASTAAASPMGGTRG